MKHQKHNNDQALPLLPSPMPIRPLTLRPQLIDIYRNTVPKLVFGKCCSVNNCRNYSGRPEQPNQFCTLARVVSTSGIVPVYSYLKFKSVAKTLLPYKRQRVRHPGLQATFYQNKLNSCNSQAV